MDSKTPLQDLPAPVSHTMEPSTHKKCKKRRLFRAVVFSALCLWLGSRYLGLGSSATIDFHRVETSWPIPSDVSVDHCAEWSHVGESDAVEDFPYSADTSFQLPVASDTLFLLSRSVGRGVFVAGRVNFLQSEDILDTVQVDVTAHFWREEHLDGAKACLLSREKDQNGIGIFSKWDGGGHRDRHDKMRFEVTVTFPQTSDDSPLSINNLSTDLHVFTQVFGDMSNIAFKSLAIKGSVGGIHAESLSTGNASIRTSVGPIRLQSLIAESADISSSVGPIEGTFNSSNTLILHTSNGPINVDVNLSNNENKQAAKLRMHTSNGYIQGNINLASSKKSDAAFDITARSSNARLKLDVLTAPIASNITLRATTSVGSAAVKLPTTYEGSFTASTSISSVAVTVDQEAEDPAGKGRARRMETDDQRRGTVRGRVGWSDEGMKRGAVSVRTSLAPVTLEF
ncbi:hypothetical protein B0H17DRAFT_1093877 [Mycena rosella]|uniref:DUF7330 domain-containing protein n=1 Tax=Mycena rosella TaxID=1033263 RepID=A0AAD7CSE9_MYCRO|nr:hypothetical protein B0H17DRAFT_1093877 [Mycena rosella]